MRPRLRFTPLNKIFILFNLALISRARGAVLILAKVNTVIFKFIKLYEVILTNFIKLFNFSSNSIAAGTKFYSKFNNITDIRLFFSFSVNNYTRRANLENFTIKIRISTFFTINSTGIFASFSLSPSNSLLIYVIFSYLIEYIYFRSSKFETSNNSLII